MDRLQIYLRHCNRQPKQYLQSILVGFWLKHWKNNKQLSRNGTYVYDI